MATAGEGSYEKGGGGKFRKRPFRRPQTTPYDRPPNAQRNTRNGGLSKVVDPASRLITASAHGFFDSVFRKRLPPPPLPPPPEVNQEPRDKLQEAVFTNSAEAQEPVISDGSNPRNSSDGSSFTQLEQILKQKTFTRFEIDRLTALLHSITVDLPVEDEEKRSEAKFSKPPDSCDRHGEHTHSFICFCHSSSLSISTAALSSFPAAPIFAFGSSVAPLTSVSPILTTSGVGSTDKEANTKQEKTFGNLTSSPFGTSPATANTGNSIFGFNGSTSSNANNQPLGGTSSKIASTGSSIFGFSGSLSSSTANIQSIGATPFGVGSGSLVSAQTLSAPGGTGIASSTQSMPIQFGLSASSPSFGVGGAPPLNSGNSLFGSSTPAKLFGSSSSGLSSLVSSSEASTSTSSTSGITSSVFSSNWQSTKSPLFGSTLNLTSPSTGFSCGGSSANWQSTKSPLFGSTLNPTSPSTGFSFGGSSANWQSTKSPLFGSTLNPTSPSTWFSFGGSSPNWQSTKSPLFGSTLNPTSPSTGFSFGDSSPNWQPTKSPLFGSTLNPTSPSTGFAFGGSSASVAGGSFSLGTGGGDKATRRMVKVKHTRRKK